jgi:hypothetical protein
MPEKRTLILMDMIRGCDPIRALAASAPPVHTTRTEQLWPPVIIWSQACTRRLEFPLDPPRMRGGVPALEFPWLSR